MNHPARWHAMVAMAACMAVPSASFTADVDRSADDAWTRLEAESRLASSSRDNLSASDLLETADRLRDFREKYAAHAAVPEAKTREARALLQAALLGEASQSSRLQNLVADVRSDVRVEDSARYEIAIGLENLAVERNSGLTPADRIDEYERIARSLQQDYPGVTAGYASLLAIAKAQPETKGVVLARELVSMPGIPGELSLEASQYVVRCELVGRLFHEVVAARDPDGIVDMQLFAGRPLVVYSWSPGHGYSQWLAEEITRLTTDDVALIALRFPGEGTAIPSANERSSRTRIQVDVGDEAGGILSWALRLSRPGLAYTIDAGGVIQSISAHNNLAAQLTALSAR